MNSVESVLTLFEFVTLPDSLFVPLNSSMFITSDGKILKVRSE